jgi:hypothetical protein
VLLSTLGVQDCPVASPVKPLPENLTVVPGGPKVVYRVSVGVGAVAYAGVGIRIAETEKNNADASSSTRYRELTRRVINSRHATDVVVGLGYLMLHV